MQGLELDVVLVEQRLVMADAGQQVPLWKPAAALSRERGGNTLGAIAEAVCAGKLSVALDFALLAHLASEHPLGLRRDTGCVRVYCGRLLRRHFAVSALASGTSVLGNGPG